MGGSSATTGWNYRLAWHDCLCMGPLDAFLEFRGADKTAWKGRMTASGVAGIDKPMLWGGDKDQGGAVGPLRVMFGSAGQLPNAYLTSLFGAKTAAWRGIATVAYEGGLWGANNPYAQKRSYRVERIVKGWDDDDCWYAGKAPVPLIPVTGGGGPDVPPALIGNIGRRVVLDPSSIFVAKRHLCTAELAEFHGFPYTLTDEAFWFWRENESGLGYIKTNNEGDVNAAVALIARGWVIGETALVKAIVGGLVAVLLTTSDEAPLAPPGYGWFPTSAFPISTSLGAVYMWFAPVEVVGPNNPSASESSGRFAKNPAHMILFAHTQQHAGRQPRETVNLANLTAAADWFYAQGFGLCAERKPKDESPREFIRRIEKVAGCSFTKSFADGLYYLNIANGEYDLDSLPVITDDDVLAFKETATVLDDAVNSVAVKYFDPERKESIITPPVRAMGLIAQFGEVHQTLEYPEIPIGTIAVRVATRELLSRITPTRVFELDCRPAVYALQRDQYVRVQLRKRDIDDMVCLVGDIKAGKLASGAYKLKLSQDIYSLPSTVYTEIKLGEDTRPPSEPAPIVAKAVFEAPYIDVVASMPAADFAALPADAGYVVGTAVNPGRMRDFTMAVAPDGGAYVDAGDGQFCPSCVIAAALAPGTKAGIAYLAAVGLANVAVGDLGLLDAELVRVDAIDPVAGTMNLGRGCGDTVPQPHAAGARIYFYQRSAAFDATQHVAGEALDVKLLANSWSAQQDPATATRHDVTMRERIARPYPPGGLTLNGESFYGESTIIPTRPGGGGGGGGGGGDPTHEGPPEMIDVTGSMPGGYVGVPYQLYPFSGDDDWKPSGGGDYVLVIGDPPPGISGIGATSSELVFVGIPLSAGTYDYAMTIRTATGTIEDTQSITIAAKPTYSMLDIARKPGRLVATTPPWTTFDSDGGGISMGAVSTGKVRAEFTLSNVAGNITIGVHADSQSSLAYAGRPGCGYYTATAAGTFAVELDADTGAWHVRNSAGTSVASGTLSLTYADDGKYRIGYYCNGTARIHSNFGNESWAITPTAGFGGLPMPSVQVPAQWDSRDCQHSWLGSLGSKYANVAAAGSLTNPGSSWEVIRAQFGKSSGQWAFAATNPTSMFGNDQRVGICTSAFDAADGHLGAAGTENSIGIRGQSRAEQIPSDPVDSMDYLLLSWCFGGVPGEVRIPFGRGLGAPVKFAFAVDFATGVVRIYGEGENVPRQLLYTLGDLPAGTYFPAVTGRSRLGSVLDDSPNVPGFGSWRHTI